VLDRLQRRRYRKHAHGGNGPRGFIADVKNVLESALARTEPGSAEADVATELLQRLPGLVNEVKAEVAAALGAEAGAAGSGSDAGGAAAAASSSDEQGRPKKQRRVKRAPLFKEELTVEQLVAEEQLQAQLAAVGPKVARRLAELTLHRLRELDPDQ
jgi:hypothetical protein